MKALLLEYSMLNTSMACLCSFIVSQGLCCTTRINCTDAFATLCYSRSITTRPWQPFLRAATLAVRISQYHHLSVVIQNMLANCVTGLFLIRRQSLAIEWQIASRVVFSRHFNTEVDVISCAFGVIVSWVSQLSWRVITTMRSVFSGAEGYWGEEPLMFG